MKKLKMHSPDLTDENIAKIRELFPNCVTEAVDEDGKPRLAVDFDQLRQELSDSIVEGAQERYRLDWPGKRAALLAANAPIAKTLRPCREESLDFDSTQNLFIEGDNLDALKLLQETYLGKVKMIYIDPPYNTGKDFIYKDNFTADKQDYLENSGQVDEEGGRLITNLESNGRFHSDWLSFLFPRLKLAKNLLTDDGVIFVSIDDNEAHNLIKVCSEIFGEENFVAQLAVQLNPRGRHLDRFIAKTHESVLIFVKDGLNEFAIQGLEKEGRMVDEYNKTDGNGLFRLLGLRNRNQSFNPQTRPNLYFPLFVDASSGAVSLERTEKFSLEILPDTPNGVQTCWTWGKDKIRKENLLLCATPSGDGWRIYRKDYLHGDDGKVSKSLVKSVWTDKEITNDYGRKFVKELFEAAIMDFPKSPELLSKLVRMGTRSNSIVLDFFAGSSSTAHALLNVNAKDGGNRKFIMVQLPEETDEKSEACKAGYKTIAEIAKERIRRAGKKILAGECHENWNKDIGFRVLKIDSSNMADVYYTPEQTDQKDLLAAVDNIKPGRDKPEDLLFQVLVDWGVDLTLPIHCETIQNKTIFFINHKPYDLIACFDQGITEELVKELATHKPVRVVFRDNGFASDAVKINVEQIFRQLAPATEVKSI